MKYIVTVIVDNNPPFNYRVEAGSGTDAMARVRDFRFGSTYSSMELQTRPYSNQEYVLDIDEHFAANPLVMSDKMKNFIQKLKH